MSESAKEVFVAKTLQINQEIMELAKRQKAVMDENMRYHKLQRSQHRLLLEIDRIGSKMSQRDLAENLHVTPAAIAVTLKQLCEDGVVAKTMSKRDNRYNEISLTAKGKRIVKDIRDVVEKADDKAFRGFTEKELDTIIKFIERAKANLAK